MRGWDALLVAHAAGAHLDGEPSRAGSGPGPRRATIDSREVTPGDLFVGLRGEHADGGAYAAEALKAGAWGVLVTPVHATAVAGMGGVVLSHPHPLAGLQDLARAWRRELGAGGTKVVAITGSTGKTSTKDILAAILSEQSRTAGTAPAGDLLPRSSAGEPAGLRTVASRENLNTEIGLPLTVLAAPSDTEVLVLELAMRGAGQIAELTAIAQPDVGVIVNVGPVHLGLLGSLEAIAAAKAELIAGLAPGATLVIPADAPLLAPHLRADLRTVTFGDGGDVALENPRPGGGPIRDIRPDPALPAVAPAGRPASSDSAEAPGYRGEVVIRDRSGAHHPDGPLGDAAAAGGVQIVLRPSFGQAHNVINLLAAVAAARVLGVTPKGRLEVRFSPLRGERLALPGGVVVIDDCYNANPMSMRAAIDDLADTALARRVAVLGDMLELGPRAPRFHREIGEHAAARGVELLVTVGPLAAEMREAFAGEGHSVPDAAAAVELVGGLLREGDTVLVKGSRGIGLERVAEALGSGTKTREHARDVPVATTSLGPGRR
jgi:UDP-N-acetylmuramoyl-tripeptide--D-alanyl-D-alanine ligase